MIRKPGCMSNPFYTYVPGRTANMPDALRLLREAGFDTVDLNMCMMQRNASELCEDGIWEKAADEIGNTAAKLGITFVQSHPPYPRPSMRRKTLFDEGCEYNEFFLRMMKRSLEIDSRLGIPWAVMHPVSCRDIPDSSPDEDVAFNLEYYAPLLDLCEARGVGFAFENMADVDGRRRFGSSPEELIAITDAFAGRKVGICWDTGHGNRMYADQIPFMKKVAPRLVCLHIDDNIGDKDLHQIPYMGTVNWEAVMKLLGDCGYPGAFIYELALYRRLPEALKMPLAKYSYTVAEYLLNL